MPLDNIFVETCALTSVVTSASRSVLACRDTKSKTLQVLARCSSGPRVLDWRYRLPRLGPTHPTLMIRDASLDAELMAHPVLEEYPMLRSLAAYWIGTKDQKDYELQIWNPAPDFFDRPGMTGAIDHVVTILRNALINLPPFQLASATLGLSEPARGSLPMEAVSKTHALTVFLHDTLVTKQRLLTRGACSYLALRQWRQNIKPYQINALAALKPDASEECVKSIAEEMTSSIQRVYGGAFQNVVPVPGGSSGKKESLSMRIARHIALNLEIDYAPVLQSAPVKKGASHPQKSLRLPPYTVSSKVDGNVLIIDDVATTGRHMERANEVLRPMAKYCASVVWIAD